MPTNIVLRKNLGRPLTVTELDNNFGNLQTAVDNKTLASLTDVAISSVVNGQLLVYNSATSKWVNASGSGAFILNGSTLQTGATFNIDGAGTLGGKLKVQKTAAGDGIIAEFGSTQAGTVFSVNDTVSGTIYAVNDVSGLPILEANSNWDFFIYDYPSVVFKKQGKAITIDGTFTLASLSGATVNTDKFLVSDGGVVKYRTAAQVTADLGLATNFIQNQTGSTQTAGYNISGNATVGGAVTFTKNTWKTSGWPNEWDHYINGRTVIGRTTGVGAGVDQGLLTLDTGGMWGSYALTVADLTANFYNNIAYIGKDGSAKFAMISATGSTDVVVSDGGVLKTRTPAQILGDIGAAPISGATNYIQNQFNTGQTANFWIAGQARVDVTGTEYFQFNNSDNAMIHAANSGSYRRWYMKNSSSAGPAAVGFLFYNDVDDMFQMYMGSSNNTSITPRQMMLRASGSGGMRLVTDSGPLVFHIGAYGTERARISSAGNLLLGGTTDNGFKLEVSGNAKVSSVLTVGSATLDATVSYSNTAGDDLLINTADVLAVAANTVILGGNASTRANVSGHVTVKTAGNARVYLDTTDKIGLGTGFDASTVPASSVHVKASTATLRVESTAAAVNTSVRVQDQNVGFGVGIRANALTIFQYPMTTSADEYTVTEADKLISFDAANKKIKVSTATYGTTPGFLKTDATGQVNLDTNAYITQNQTITLSGDVTGTGTTAITATLANVGTAGTYSKVTTDAKGRVTSGGNVAWSDLGYTPVNKAGDTMSGFLTLSADPTNAMHAVTKQYADAIAQGLTFKTGVRVASTANITTLSGLLTVDGITLVAGDRVLVKDQTTKSQNGVYVAASGAWTRATDFDADADVKNGAYIFVEEGTANKDSAWVMVTDGTVTFGTTSLDFVQFSGAGQITAGTGLTKSNNTLSLANTAVTANTYGDYGKTPQITVNQQGQLTAASDKVTGFAGNIGDGTTGPFTVTHNLNSRFVVVQVFDNTTYDQINPDIQRTTANTVTISGFMNAVAANKYSVVVHRVV